MPLNPIILFPNKNPPSVLAIQDKTYASVSALASHSITLPGGPRNGDLLLLFYACGAVATTPSGWTRVAAYGGSNVDGGIFWKYAGASEPSTVTVPLANPDQACLYIVELTNIAASNAVDQTNVNDIVTGTTIDCGPLNTTTYANELIFAMCAITVGGVTVSSYSSSFVPKFPTLISGAGAGTSLSVATKAVSSTGIYDTIGTLSASSTGNFGAMISIKGNF